MGTIKEKYINPFTDYSFEKLFGEEPNEDSLKYYRDLRNSLYTAREEGKEEGKKEEKNEIAKNLLKNNVPIEIIINSTGLTKEQIELLNNK